MKRSFFHTSLRLTMVAALEVLCIVVLTGQAAEPVNKAMRGKTYRIGSQSSLTLEGTSNVNEFRCECTESFPPQLFFVENLNDENCTVAFRETYLNLRIKSLDCGNKMMNKDLQNSLNADKLPNIRIEVLQVAEEKCDLLGDESTWTKFIALSKITLNGKSHNYWMNIIVRKSGPNQFRFLGDKVLKMTDFDIKPPSVALGMIKVRDEIRIAFDMLVIVE